jgi:hypothetical protein
MRPKYSGKCQAASGVRGLFPCPGSLRFESFGQCLGSEELGSEVLCAKGRGNSGELVANNLH